MQGRTNPSLLESSSKRHTSSSGDPYESDRVPELSFPFQPKPPNVVLDVQLGQANWGKKCLPSSVPPTLARVF